jgi:hypothetical protein
MLRPAYPHPCATAQQPRPKRLKRLKGNFTRFNCASAALREIWILFRTEQNSLRLCGSARDYISVTLRAKYIQLNFRPYDIS